MTPPWAGVDAEYAVVWDNRWEIVRNNLSWGNESAHATAYAWLFVANSWGPSQGRVDEIAAKRRKVIEYVKAR